MYATLQGKSSNGKATFDWFEYKGNDPMYENISAAK
ncbi:hypothetical protein [Pontibacter harenae]|nr:hypothetical protein [Pontibacter harenae]MCC9166482.1 hypothetical protein [Pontibacter harenae]